jgi:hypothetical protein
MNDESQESGRPHKTKWQGAHSTSHCKRIDEPQQSSDCCGQCTSTAAWSARLPWLCHTFPTTHPIKQASSSGRRPPESDLNWNYPIELCNGHILTASSLSRGSDFGDRKEWTAKNAWPWLCRCRSAVGAGVFRDMQPSDYRLSAQRSALRLAET